MKSDEIFELAGDGCSFTRVWQKLRISTSCAALENVLMALTDVKVDGIYRVYPLITRATKRLRDDGVEQGNIGAPSNKGGRK
jgi:hypothetical protein